MKAGGEGLMLHRGASLYRGERNDDLLKLKPYDDAEAVVVGHVPGKGRTPAGSARSRCGRPGACASRLGTGLTDAERRDPPPVGSTVTYRYVGLNASGVPRFASFLRVRTE